jgi:hypothetical protein
LATRPTTMGACRGWQYHFDFVSSISILAGTLLNQLARRNPNHQHRFFHVGIYSTVNCVFAVRSSLLIPLHRHGSGPADQRRSLRTLAHATCFGRQPRYSGRWAFGPRPFHPLTEGAATKSAPSSSPEKSQLPYFQLQGRTVSGHGKQRREEFQGLTRNAKEH